MTAGATLNRLFVYGTLQPGHLRWPWLEPFVRDQRPAEVRGSLFDSQQGWPVAVFGASVDVVPGVLVLLATERVQEALLVLDEVEHTATQLLARIVVRTSDGDAAWAYHCIGPTGGMVRIAAWHGGAER